MPRAAKYMQNVHKTVKFRQFTEENDKAKAESGPLGNYPWFTNQNMVKFPIFIL